MDPFELTAAAFFRNKGKNVVTENEFFMGISMDLRWMTPGETKELAALLVRKGILEKDGEYLRPKFDIAAAEVPIGFRPPADMMKNVKRTAPAASAPSGTASSGAAPADGLLSKLMAAAESMGMKRKDFIVAVNAIQKRMNVDIEIASLILLRDNGADVSGYCSEAYETIAKR